MRKFRFVLSSKLNALLCTSAAAFFITACYQAAKVFGLFNFQSTMFVFDCVSAGICLLVAVTEIVAMLTSSYKFGENSLSLTVLFYKATVPYEKTMSFVEVGKDFVLVYEENGEPTSLTVCVKKGLATEFFDLLKQKNGAIIYEKVTEEEPKNKK